MATGASLAYENAEENKNHDQWVEDNMKGVYQDRIRTAKFFQRFS